MKIKFIVIVVIIVISCIGYNMHSSQNLEVASNLTLSNIDALAGCEQASYDTSYQDYITETRCRCLACVEVQATNCHCQGSGPL